MLTALLDGKVCSSCKEEKPYIEYHKDKNSPNGHAYYCKLCAITKSKAHHKRRIVEDPAYQRQKREGWVKRAHGLTLHEYEEKLAAQGSCCAICDIELAPAGHLTHLDHNHETGKLRDFLCTNCNRGLGHFQDSPALLSMAMAYLERHICL